MNGYFKPLRQKIGVVALGLACLFAVGWVRSLFKIDRIRFSPFDNWNFYIISQRGNLHCGQGTSTAFSKSFEWDSSNLPLTEAHTWIETSRNWRGIPTATALREINIISQLTAWPYWSIVIPLTLLSAWLLLSRPRSPKSLPPVTENA